MSRSEIISGIIIVGLVSLFLSGISYIVSVPQMKKDAHTKGRVEALTEVRDALYGVGNAEYQLQEHHAVMETLGLEQADDETKKEFAQMAQQKSNSINKSYNALEKVFLNDNVHIGLKGWKIGVDKDAYRRIYHHRRSKRQ